MTQLSQASTSPATYTLAPFSPRRIFITGASGYVGRNLIRQFIRTGDEVIALVRNRDTANFVRGLGAAPFLSDILSPTMVDGMTGCDVLVHAAANTDHGLGTPEQRRTNEEGTRLVFQSAREAGIGRAVHISSDSVLADGRPIINANETWQYPRRPAGGYSRSKATAEKVALSFNSSEMNVIVIRPRFVWGRDDTTALPHLVQAARSGQMAWIGGGTYMTSTTHIANLCAGIELALRNGSAGQVYFITDGAPVEFRRFVTQLLETQDIHPPQKSVPRAFLLAIARIGDVLGTLSRGRIVGPLTLQSFATSAVEVTLDISKARSELGYQPVVSREQGLDEMRRDQVVGGADATGESAAPGGTRPQPRRGEITDVP